VISNSARDETTWMKLLVIQPNGDLAAQAPAELPALHKRAGNRSAADRETKKSQRLKGGANQPLYKE
jgi:hypothetical protein